MRGKNEWQIPHVGLSPYRRDAKQIRSTGGGGLGLIRYRNDLPFGDSLDVCIPVAGQLLAASPADPRERLFKWLVAGG